MTANITADGIVVILVVPISLISSIQDDVNNKLLAFVYGNPTGMFMHDISIFHTHTCLEGGSSVSLNNAHDFMIIYYPAITSSVAGPTTSDAQTQVSLIRKLEIY